MIELQLFRDYKTETMFMAVAIFDRYIFQATMGNAKAIEEKEMNEFVCTCLLLAAKFEQPMKPDFYNMVYAIKELKGVQIQKHKLIQLEQ